MVLKRTRRNIIRLMLVAGCLVLGGLTTGYFSVELFCQGLFWMSVSGVVLFWLSLQWAFFFSVKPCPRCGKCINRYTEGVKAYIQGTGVLSPTCVHCGLSLLEKPKQTCELSHGQTEQFEVEQQEKRNLAALPRHLYVALLMVSVAAGFGSYYAGNGMRFKDHGYAVRPEDSNYAEIVTRARLTFGCCSLLCFAGAVLWYRYVPNPAVRK